MAVGQGMEQSVLLLSVVIRLRPPRLVEKKKCRVTKAPGYDHWVHRPLKLKILERTEFCAPFNLNSRIGCGCSILRSLFDRAIQSIKIAVWLTLIGLLRDYIKQSRYKVVKGLLTWGTGVREARNRCYGRTPYETYRTLSNSFRCKANFPRNVWPIFVVYFVRYIFSQLQLKYLQFQRKMFITFLKK